MRKFLMTLALVFGLLGAAHAEVNPGTIIDILKEGGVTSLATASELVTYSTSFPLLKAAAYGWQIQFSSSGTVNVKVEVEQGFDRPTTEGTTDPATYVVPDNKTTELISVDDELLHVTAYAPDATPYARLKITGLTGNDASTTLTTAKIYVIKE
jgi:Flp pilus assembly protein TadG